MERYAFNSEVSALDKSTSLDQPYLCHAPDCVNGNVNADPATIKSLRGFQRGRTSTKWIEHNVSGPGTGCNDAFKHS